MKALVSVIVPLYEAEQFMKKCVDSLLNQTYDNVEIILVNDGSKDNTVNICKEYEKEHSNIIVVDAPHGGVSVTRNIGLHYIKGDYFTFVDSDDWVEPTFVEDMIEKIIKNDAELAVCGYKKYYSSNNVREEISTENNCVMTGEEVLYSMLKPNGTFTSLWNKMYSSKLLKADSDLHLFNEELTIGEDEVWLVELLSNVSKAVWVDKALYVWNQREGSITHTKSFEAWKMTELDAKQKVVEFLENTGVSSNIKKLACVRLNKSLIRYTRLAYFAHDKDAFDKVKKMRKGKIKFSDYFVMNEVSRKHQIKIMVCDLGIQIRVPAKILEKMFK